MSRTCLLHAMALGAWLTGGCSQVILRSPSPSPSDTTKAVLAAADAGQINLFGDLPDGAAPEYFARAVVSLKRHTFSEVGRDFDPDLDPAGERIVFASTRHHVRPALYLKSRDGFAVTQLTSDPASHIHPKFSPDGSRIAFASDRAGSWDIWIMDLDGGPAIQVTAGDADEVHPSWSPDGRQIVFCSLSLVSGQWELWLVDATRRAGKRFIGLGLFPEWSPVDNRIAFQRAREMRDRRFSLWTVSLVDGEPRYPMEIASSRDFALILPSWSPDGRRITYTSSTVFSSPDLGGSASDNGPFDVWVINADGTGSLRLTDGMTRNFSPTFGTDGRVYFASDRGGSENIWSLAAPHAGAPAAGNDVRSATGAEGNAPMTPSKVRTTADKDGF